jgi:hypothetical protein
MKNYVTWYVYRGATVYVHEGLPNTIIRVATIQQMDIVSHHVAPASHTVMLGASQYQWS